MLPQRDEPFAEWVNSLQASVRIAVPRGPLPIRTEVEDAGGGNVPTMDEGLEMQPRGGRIKNRTVTCYDRGRHVAQRRVDVVFLHQTPRQPSLRRHVPEPRLYAPHVRDRVIEVPGDALKIEGTQGICEERERRVRLLNNPVRPPSADPRPGTPCRAPQTGTPRRGLPRR